ncbi:hypothetical protein AGMMS49944_25460 [Spirochaetia bacterium]|nr:hypothetical protein AGMMS49944_25460 [Spirochaetia bacterium]
MKEPSRDGVIETLKSDDPVAIISNPNNSDKIEELLYYLRDNNVSGLIQHITEYLKENNNAVAPVLNGIISLYPLTIELLNNLDKSVFDSGDTSLTIKKFEALEKLIVLVVSIKNELGGMENISSNKGLTWLRKQIKNLEDLNTEIKNEIGKLSVDNKKLEETKKALAESGKEKSALQQEKELLEQELLSFDESHLQAQIAEKKAELSKKQKEREISKKELSNLKAELENVKEIDHSHLYNEIDSFIKKSNSNEKGEKND